MMNKKMTTEAPPPLNPMLCTKQAARLLGISNRTLEGMRSRGEGPSFYRLGRNIRYMERDLIKWMCAGREDTIH